MKKVILIIEDEFILQDVYKMILESKGYTIHTANNGAEGLIQLKKVRPDLVLLDAFMPVMNGLDFLRHANVTDYPSTTFIGYTNLSDKETENEMIRLGASKVVLKSSMSPAELIQLVAESLLSRY